MTNWIDTIVVGIIVVGGLFILYSALKEPLDLFFGFIGRILKSAFGGLKDGLSGVGGTATEVISYG